MTSLEYYIEQVEQFISALTDDIESGEGTVVTQTKLAVYREVLEHLEEIEQEPKTAHWIEKDGFDGDVYYDCSECGESWTTIEGTPWQNGMDYCPNCGCRMVKPQESEEV